MTGSVGQPDVGGATRAADIVVSENRISIVQEPDLQTLTVVDEMWVVNQGDEPYVGTIYTKLPENIHTSDGMFCKVSESGGHSCFPWKQVSGYYYWDSSFVIMPQDFEPDFDLNVSIEDTGNKSITSTLKTRVTKETENITYLYEEDPWGWVRNGFLHAWTLVEYFNVTNPTNESLRFEFSNNKVPEGLTLHLYIDNNNNGILESEDVLAAYDRDLDGIWSPNFDMDKNNNSVPDIMIEANSTQNFFIYLRADMSHHFLVKYQTVLENADDGKIEYSKQTYYDTTLMRLFIIPKGGDSPSSEQVTLSKRNAGTQSYYYGEWSGGGNTSVIVGLTGAKISSSDDGGFTTELGLLLMGIAVVLACVLGFFYFRKKPKEKKKGHSKRSSSSKKSRHKRLGPKEREAASDDADADDIDDDVSGRKEQLMDTFLKLEAQLESGAIDQEAYNASKKIYIDYLKELKEK